MIKRTNITIGETSFPMLYCDNCGEGTSERPEDDKAVQEFKKVHKNKLCPKLKNTKIGFKHLPDAPI